MSDLSQMNLVGMVIGSIAQNSPPLVYALHTNAVLEMRVEIVKFTQYDTSLEILRVLRGALGARLKKTYKNDSAPPWYYVQLDIRYPTHKLANWHLPLTVYFAQWKEIGPE